MQVLGKKYRKHRYARDFLRTAWCVVAVNHVAHGTETHDLPDWFADCS